MTSATLDRPAGRLPLRRIALAGMLVAAVAWAFAWGAHRHGPVVIAADLSTAAVDRTLVVDASTGALDLSNVAVQPGEVIGLVLQGSAGSPHDFVLTGTTPGAEIDQSVDAAGDTVIRMRVPDDGAFTFLCTIPGHEGLHGTLISTLR